MSVVSVRVSLVRVASVAARVAELPEGRSSMVDLTIDQRGWGRGRDMGDQIQPDGDEGANRDPWAPPESRTSLEKGAQPTAPAPGPQPYPQDQQPAPGRQPNPQDQPPPAAQQPPPQSPSVHNQATVTSMPADGFAPPGSGAPGYGQPGTPPGLPSYGAPGYGGPNAPGGYGPPGAPHAQSGWSESAAPPPPNGPGGPGMQGGPGMPGGYGYPGYPQGYGWPGMPMAPQNGMGTAAMVLGILSCCLFCIYGVVSLGLGITAIVLGVKAKKRADRGEATNRGQAQAGFITGIIGTVLGILVIAFLIVAVVIAIKHDNDDTTDSDPFYNSAPSLTAPLAPQT